MDGEFNFPKMDDFADFDSFGSIEPSSSAGLTPPKGRNVWNKKATIYALVGAVIGIALEIALNLFVLRGLQAGSPVWHDVLMIGTSVMLVCGCAFAGLILHAQLEPQKMSIKNGFMIPIAIVSFLILGCLMQFVYGLGYTTTQRQADDYIFLIDDSGSMARTDPNNERVTAMKYILGRVPSDRKVAMVFFTDEITYEHSFAQINEQTINEFVDAVDYLKSDGNTWTAMALSHALSMDGVDDPDRLTEIVYLTDGAGGNVNIREMSKICEEKNVRISAIFMKDRSSMSVIQGLVERTGGTMYTVDDLDQLLNAYSNVFFNHTNRNLLGIRTGKTHSSLFAALFRVLAWMVIGANFGMMVMLTFRYKGTQAMQIAIGGVCGLILGGLLEIINLLWLGWGILGSEFGLLLMWVLCLVWLHYEKFESGPPYSGSIENSFTSRSTDAENTGNLRQAEKDHKGVGSLL